MLLPVIVSEFDVGWSKKQILLKLLDKLSDRRWPIIRKELVEDYYQCILFNVHFATRLF